MSNDVRSAAGVSAATTLMAALVALAGVALCVPLIPSARAAEPVAFSIPAEDGYGIAECMQAGNACGAAMAESWCSAHGHAKAVAFGLTADVTGTVPGASPQTAGEAVMIRCGD